MKHLRSIGVLLVVLLSGFLFGSCEIGLGSAVDTEPPAVNIVTPGVDVVIRDSFAIKGTWSDDGEIDSLTATLERTDGIGDPLEFVGEVLTNEGDDNSGTWKILVNPKEQGILDGTYQVTISIKDKGEHVTTQTRTFTIDNTAPLIVLQRPSSKADATSVDSYGQSFTLTGQAADDNNVSLIRVKIYSDPECTNLIHTVDLKNVPPTIELDVAKFVEGEDNDYSKIYGSTTKDGEKQFYCAIEAYDGAQRYPIEGNQSAEDTNGNYTTTYYLYEEVATAILSQYKITEVYHMYCGTYTNSDGSRAADVANSVKEILSEKVVNFGSFSLNPANNPTFAVSGRDQLKKDGTDFSSVVNNISNDSDLIIEVSVGLDAIPLKSDTLKVYLQKCDDNGAAVTTDRYYPTNSTKQKSGTSYKFVTHIKKDELVDANGNAVNVNYGDKFIVGVEGEDEKGTPIVAAGKGYGVKLAASGAAPILDVRSFVNPTATTTDAEYTDDVQFAVARYKDNRASVKEDTVIRLKGYTQVEEGEPTFRILVDNTPLTGVSLTPDATVGKFTFEKDITSSNFTNPGVNGQHTIKVESEQNLKSTVTLTVIYDVEEPTIKVISVTPTAYKYEAEDESKTKSTEKYLNGNINIDISLQDAGRSDIYIEEGVTPKVEFIQDGQVKDTIYFTNSESTGKTITNFDTVNKLIDNKPVTIRITAKDGAGNTSVKDELYNVCQDTDKPVLLPYDSSETGVTLKSDYEPGIDNTHKKNLFSESQSFLITVIDDDGIQSVKLEIFKQTDLVNSYKTINRGYNDIHGATEYQLDAQAPDIAGTFIAKLSAKDINNVSSVEKTFTIRVTKAAPTVTSRITNKDKASKNGNVANEVKLTVNISSDQKPFTLYRTIKNSSGTVITGESHKPVAGNTVLNTENPVYTDTIKVKDLNLASGTYTVVYSAEDSTPKEGSDSVATTFYVDNDAPTITTDDTLKVPSVTETESTNSSFTFIGSANTGDEIYQSLISKVELTFTDGSATAVPANPEIIEASGTTSWNKEVVFGNYKENGAFFATEGSKKLWVRATDEVGNVGNWVSKEFVYDTAKPEITFTNKPTRLGIDPVTLNGTIVEKNGFTSGTKLKITEKVDGGDEKTAEISLGTPTNGVYPWSVSIPLTGHETSSGTFSYKFEIKDKAEKLLSNNNTFNADRDLTAPVITLSNPNDTTYGEGSISKSDTVIKGEITETYPRNIYYKLFKKGTTEPTNYTTVDISQVSDVIWTFSVDNLSEGEYTIKLYADDTSGNTCSVITQDFMVDKNPPEITYAVYKLANAEDTTGTKITNSDKLESVNVTDGYAFVLKGKISDTNGIKTKSIKINGSETGVSYNSTTGEWKYPLSGTPSEGTYNCEIEVEDVSGKGSTIGGKTSTLKRKVVFDKTKPTGEVNVSGWLKSQGETYLTGTASDGTNGSGVAEIKFTLKKGETVIINKADIPLSSSWSYSFDVDDLAESTSSTDVYTVLLDLKDNVGLQNTITKTFSLDRSIPVVEDFSADRNYISKVSGSQNSVKFSGTVFDGEKTAYRSVSKAYLAAYKKAEDGSYAIYNLTGTTATDDYSKSIAITAASAHTSDAQKAAFGKFETTISLTGENVDKLTEGEYKFKIIGEDLSGRKYNSSEIALVVDNTPPAATFNESSFSPVAKDVSSTKWYNKNSIKINATVTENNLQTIEASVNATATNPDWSPLSKDSTTGKYEGFVSSLAEGDNTITLKMIDLAGNTNTATMTVKVDTKAPDTCSGNSGTILCQGETPFVFNVTPADATGGSGIKSVTLTKVADLTKDIAGALQSDGSYKITIPANTSGQQNNQKEGMVEVTVEDNVGNKQSFQVFKLDVDSEAPTISFSSIADGGTVNSKIVISGTATDNKTVSSVKVERQTGTNTWTEVGTMTGTPYSWSYNNIDTDTAAFISYDADTTKAGKQVKLRATATDESGRTSVETITVTVDQDTDRPVIKFSNLTQINGAYYLKYGTSAQLEGIITDDDSTPSAVIDTFIVSTSAVTSTTGWTKGGSGDTVTYTKGTEVTSYNKKTGEFTFKPSNTNDGAKNVYFYVKDNAGTEFYTANNNAYTTATTIKKQLYYQNKTDTTTKAGSTAAVTYTSDSESPTIESKQIQAYKGSTKNGDKVTPGTNVFVGGIEKNKVQFIVEANDASGIASMTLELKNANGTTLKSMSSATDTTGTFTPSSNGSSNAKWETSLVDVSGWTSGSISLAITATDNCGLYGNANEVFMLDNAGPVINISSPLTTDEVTASVSVTGQATDSSAGSDDIKFLIPTTAQRTACTTWKASNSGKTAEDYFKTVTTGWEGKLHGSTTVNAFEFLFNNDTSTDNYSLNHYTKDGTATYGLTPTEDVYTVPVYFKAVDKLGNVTVKEYTIKYNPDADKPKTQITYPSSRDYDKDTNGDSKGYVTLGGSIRVNGSIEIPSMTTTPDKVYIQIANSTGAFNATDKAKAGTGSGNYGYTIKTITNVETDIAKEVLGLSDTAKSNWWGIEATRASNSWSFILNDNQQLETVGGNTIKIRVCGINAEGKMGSWSEPVTIKIDADAPQYTSKMYQFTGTPAVGTQTAEREYETGMFLKGQWYIGAHISDPDKVVVENAKKDGALLTKNTDYWVVTASDQKSADVFIKLDSAATELKTYTISARDNATGNYHYITPSYEVNVDNTAPSIDPILSGDGYKIEMTKQSASNFVTTFGSSSTDNGSGVSRIAFYFKRGSKIELPIPAVNNASTNEWKIGTAYSEELTTTNDNMYGKTLTGTKETITGGTKFTATGVSNNSYIRAGGLVQILGTYYKIASVSGNVVTINTEIDSAFTTAFFPAVMVIDNSSSENSSWTNGINKQKGDDGDGMVESFKKSGATWTWDASIYSSELDDGEVTLVCVAFDVAGNSAKLETNIMFANKTPRLNKVFLATDLNGDGKYTLTEQGTSVISSSGAKTVEHYYSALNAGAVQDVLTIYGNTSDTENSTTDSGITMRDNLGLAFEFVSGYEGYGAGQGNIYYKMSVGNAAITVPETATNLTTTLSSGSSPFQDESCSSLKYMNVETSNFVGNNHPLTYTEDALNYLHLTLWDSANNKQGTLDGATSPVSYKNAAGDSLTATRYASFGAQWTVVNIPLYMDLVDSIAPTVTIADPEAVVESSTEKGHVDLGSSLSGFTETSGEFDADDKVSGEIKFTVTVNDEKRINTVKLDSNFNGTATNYTIGSYSNGTFAITGATPVTGITFEIAEQTFDITTGHTVKFNVTIDTTNVSGGAKSDVTFTLTASDGTNTGSDANKMDVVPYITSVKRSSTVVDTHRSKLGKYQVVIGESLDVKGFNLPTGDSYYRVTTAAKETKTVPDSNKVTSVTRTITSAKLTAPNNSGYIVAVKNGVMSLNNMNNNTVDNNKQTGINDDDEWTDDVYLSCWKNNEYFAGSNDPISPAMDGIKSGNIRRLYGGWAANSSRFYASYPDSTSSTTTGNAPSPATGDDKNGTGSQNFGDPGTYYDVITDGNGNRYNLVLDCWQGNNSTTTTAGYWGKNFVINKNGKYTHNGTSSNGNVTDTNIIERMGYDQVPGQNTSSTGYDSMFNQFINPRITYKNNWAYITYYDRYAKCLKFASMQFKDGSNDKQNKYTTEGNYTNGKYVVAGYETLQNGGTKSALDVGIWSSIAVDTESGKTDSPVIAYYDSKNRCLMIATANTRSQHPENSNNNVLANNTTNTAPTGGTNPGQGNAWKRQTVTGSDTLRLGQYVSMVTDSNNNLHIACYGTKGGNKLYYIYGLKSSYGTYTFTTTCIDPNGAGTWTDIQLDASGNPVISYYDPSNDSSENAIKVAYTDGTNWDTMTAPLASSATSNRATLALNVTDGDSVATATVNNSKLAVGYVSSRFDCIYLRNE